MAKIIDLSKTVFELVQEHPEIVDVFKNLGLSQIGDPTILATVGKKLTIPEGLKARGFSLDTVINALKAAGFGVKQ